ncbi:energy coupling factor transporter S component ThiW [Levilactobacillus tongjiangensis]|uniref:Energy coupling factor transporter S component ThiW n=1 Tax=Levilactobacillus tongjiangensis TaxID=2486023 RepID=A0ABW1SSU4_9LACO|nr:energy coupling factor transporter S component ThiW [Levilactobacillus tongjiangensis]
MSKKVYPMTLTAMLVALGVIGGSLFSFSIGVAKVAPVQHLINLVSGVLLGPWWAVAQAFLTSLIRNLMGTGTVLAFPGSMIGAFLSGWLFRLTGKLVAGLLGEMVGSGILGALVAYPVAAWLMGTTGAVWLFLPSFFMSAMVGALVGYVLLKSMWSTVIAPQLTKLRGK